MVAIRGAITVDSNTREEILAASKTLLTGLITSNSLEIRQIVSIIFTATHDLNQAYPAVAARELGVTDAGLICMQEMRVEGSLPQCLRVMILAEKDMPQAAARHLYLKGAVRLRPELAGFFAVAIDGPAGVGKGTLAKKLAEALNFTYVDTGALYRAVAYFCIREGVSPDDPGRVESVLSKLEISAECVNNTQRVLLGGEDVTDSLRTPEISEASSKVAAIPAVRAKLLKLQRDIAEGANVVMEGRDIGVKILPFAQVKIYLDAGLDERARRRYTERAAEGIGADLGAIKRELEERDLRDARREDSPLAKAGDAVLIDSTDMSPWQVTEAALRIIHEKTGGLHGGIQAG